MKTIQPTFQSPLQSTLERLLGARPLIIRLACTCLLWLSAATSFANAGAPESFGMNAPVTGLVDANPVLGGPFCEGQQLTVSFTVNGTLLAGNLFTVELSDANGNFTNPLVLGTKPGTTHDTMHVLIPSVPMDGSGYRIRVNSSNPGTLGNANPNPLTIRKLPATPVLTALGPTQFCEGNSVVLESSSMLNNVWTPGGQTAPTLTVTIGGDYAVMVSNQGCLSAPSNHILVTVSPTPPVPVVTIAGSTTFCDGDSVQLTSSIPSGNIWMPGNLQSQTITVHASGTYTVSKTNIFGCTSTSQPVNVTMNAKPATPAITPNGPTTFCGGGNVILTSSSSVNNVWSNGATSASIVVTTAGTYSVMVHDGNCASDTSGGETVTISPTPLTPLIGASGPMTMCDGDSLVLTSSAPYGIIWAPYNEQTQSIVVRSSGTYTVTKTNIFGCSATSNPAVVVVNPIPAIPTISASGPLEICPGDSIVLMSSSPTGNLWFPTGDTTTSIVVFSPGNHQVGATVAGCTSAQSMPATVTVRPTAVASFTATVLGSMVNFIDLSSNNPSTYAWTFGDGGSSTLAQPTHTYAAPGTYTVCLTVTSVCGSNTTCQAVTICTQPTAAYNYVATALTVDFAAQLPIGSNPSYTWDFGDGSTSTSMNPTHTFAAYGSYYVCLTVVTDCGAYMNCSGVTLSCPTPSANFTGNAQGLTVDFIDLSTNATQWHWDFGDGNTSAFQNPTHHYSTQGNYNVCLLTTNDCGTDNHCTTLGVLTGVTGSTVAGLQAFPNPAQDQITVTGIGTTDGQTRLALTDLLGRELLFTVVEATGEFSHVISLESLASGVYCIKVTSTRGEQSLRIVRD